MTGDKIAIAAVAALAGLATMKGRGSLSKHTNYSGDQGYHTVRSPEASLYLITFRVEDANSRAGVIEDDEGGFTFAGVIETGHRGRHRAEDELKRLVQQNTGGNMVATEQAIVPLSKRSAEALLASGDASVI